LGHPIDIGLLPRPNDGFFHRSAAGDTGSLPPRAPENIETGIPYSEAVAIGAPDCGTIPGSTFSRPRAGTHPEAPMPSQIPVAPSCADSAAPESLSLDEARRRILAEVAPIARFQKVALRDALGRTLAEPVISPLNVPSHTNSAMDGFAMRGADLPGDGAVELELVGEALAGHPYGGGIGAGQCIRITTGAPMPSGADTVVMQERALDLGGRVRVDARSRAGQNVRQAGEDMAAGDAVLEPGRTLTPADLGLMASLGVAEVAVRRRPRVAFFSTGDELRSIGQPLGEGDVYDSNRYTLFGMLTRLGVDILDMGVVPDVPELLDDALQGAAADADLVLTSGGVSVGEADYIKGLLERIGSMGFWKIAMKPGRPLTFGRIGGSLFLGLPGNPVAVMVTFYQLVQPALVKLMTGREEPTLLVRAEAACRLRKRPGRTEYPRGILSRGADGVLRVDLTGRQGSGVLRSMSLANCFIVMEREQGDLEPGDQVMVQPFAGLI
jgi:molybdopterin molybdotransferase